MVESIGGKLWTIYMSWMTWQELIGRKHKVVIILVNWYTIRLIWKLLFILMEFYLALAPSGNWEYLGAFRLWPPSNSVKRPLDQCELLLQDLLDGFFPSELQARYPDGLIFDIVDLHNRPFDRMFPGVGKRIDEPVVDCRGKATTKSLKYWHLSDKKPRKDPSVIKTSDLLEMMPETFESQSIPERLKSARPPTRGKSSGPMATLRVKTFEGILFDFSEYLINPQEQITLSNYGTKIPYKHCEVTLSPLSKLILI